MKANELTCKDLMVGDWVSYGGTPIKVENVYEDCINFQHDIPFVQEELLIEQTEIEPIPLTAEILEKNGFYYGYTSREEDATNNTPVSLSETDKGWCWDEGSGAIKVIFPNEADGGLVELDDQSFNRYLSFVFCDNLYVHELQRVLRLCGITREIII